ncbi:hypothetical protein PDO_2411 [Rhizobium sp. PDO1-076]|nr:hypothetical protein PDO_2411 [Rhizobium sp. PDO1-076]
MTSTDIAILKSIEKQVLWLACWMIHNANHLREKGEVKVGGHQASSASMASILTALYCHVLGPEDRIAVKPHASPVFHAIQYLMGNQTRDKLENFVVSAVRSPIRAAPRISTMSISPPVRSASASA